MELYQQLLVNILAKQDVHVSFPGLKMDAAELVRLESVRALERIEAVIKDDRLGDEECFAKIEEIARLVEELGRGSGGRHDFG